MANIIVNNGRILGGQKSFRKYIRNPEYIDLPALSNGDQKVVMLAKIYEKGGNHFRIYARGNYNVDWGDGQSSVNYNDNTNADYSISWSNISNTTETTNGYRQAIITVTPQSGSNLTEFKIGQHTLNPNDVNVDTANIQIFDVKMAGANFTTLQDSFTDILGLEQFEFVGTCNVTSLQSTFYLCPNLRKVVGIDTSNVTSFYRAFRQCETLLETPKFDLSSATNVEQMYYNCYKLEYIKPYDLDNDGPNITSIFTMFDGCQRLLVCPITSCTNITNFGRAFYKNQWGGEFNLDCSSATNVTNMFQDCFNILKIGATFPSNLTNTSYMFDNCYSLEEVKLFDCSNVTNSSFMFRGTYRLKDLSAFDFSSATNMQYMFINSGIEKSPSQLGGGTLTYFAQGCVYVKEWGNFNGTTPSSIIRAFLSNISLEVLPNIVISTNVTSFTNAFDTLRSLSKIPSWDVSNVTNASTWFQNAYSLVESNVTGMTVSHSYLNCNLEKTEIVNIFNKLGTAASSATITVTNNPGASELTASDLLIATDKGWTVAS